MSEHTKSIWQNDVVPPEFNAQTGHKNTDVLIVGGGIAGILCAAKLQRAGMDYMLVEADRICHGITGSTTAKITLQHGLIYHRIIDRFGEDYARLYAQAQQKATEEYRRICEGIECDYETRDSFVYSLNDRQKIEKELSALKRIGIKAEVSDADELPMVVAGAVCVKEQAMFHPLKFLYTVARDLVIFEHTKVVEFLPGRVKTDHGSIGFKKLIIATHFPLFNKHGLYPLKLYQHRSYVLALRGVKELRGLYVDDSDRGLSFRSYGDLLLLGGGGHRTGKQGGCWQELEEFSKRHYTGAKIVAKWATQDCMTLDGMPYIGPYSKSTPDVFVATGFQKWGMTNAMVAADILCDLVCEKTNAYAKIFSPSRHMAMPQLAINALQSAIGILTPTVPRCPHLGCALKYNRAEHTWDCPCHGSRFSADGRLIDNPATDDKRK